MAFLGALLGVGKALFAKKAVTSAIGAVGSHLLQSRAAKKQRQESLDDDASRFIRTRDGSIAAGYNPLTGLQHGGTTTLASGVTPPLASAAALRDVSQDFGDLISGREAQQATRDKLETDLAKVRLDQAIAQIKAGNAPKVGVRAKRVGKSPVTKTASRSGTGSGGPFGGSRFATGREVDVAKLSNSPGVFVLENNMTGGGITIPGDGEPWGIDELATAVVVGGPQVLYNKGKQAYKEFTSDTPSSSIRSRYLADPNKFEPGKWEKVKGRWVRKGVKKAVDRFNAIPEIGGPRQTPKGK